MEIRIWKTSFPVKFRRTLPSKEKDIRWKTAGSASDGNFTSALGVPTIDALGPMGGGAHTPGEYGVVHDIVPKFEILCELAEYVLGK